MASTTIHQTWRNDGGGEAEAVWVLPLPEGAVADGFTMTINGVPTAGDVLDANEARGVYEGIVRSKLKFLEYAPVIFVSAQTGERTEDLFALINQAWDAHNRRVTTGELNRWFDQVDLDRGTSPASRKVRIYYITQASTAPPTFVLFTNQQRPLHFSYERFLENQLRAAFDFTGTPVRFHQRLKKR